MLPTARTRTKGWVACAGMTAAPEATRADLQRPLNPICIWCGAPARSIGSRLVECEVCGSATTYPRPDEAELDRPYSGSYRPPSGRFAAGGDRLLLRSRATLARRLGRIIPAGPVLDVGCGDGVLLGALRRRRRPVLGLERSANRPDVRAVEITELRDRRRSWACVVFWHSLEHLGDPAAAIDQAVELLASRGVLVIAVPNWGSWQARVFRRSWFALDLPRHLVHLSAPAVIQELRRRGLDIERVSYWRGGQVVFGWLHGLVALLPGNLDLYDALRRAEASSLPMTRSERLRAIGCAAALWPVAFLLAAIEVAARAGGTVYVEARRP